MFFRALTNKNIPDEDRSKLGLFSSLLGIFLNTILCIGKFFAGSLSSSISIQADAFNNLTDAVSSLVTLFGFKLAEQKADKQHPFGHGRIEYVSGLIVSIFILFMGFDLSKSSFEKIISPVQTENSAISLYILGASLLVKLFLAFYYRRIGKAIDSSALCAAGTDSLSDCAASFSVFAGLLLQEYFNISVDGYIGLLVSVLIFISGIKALNETISPLLGQPPTPEFVKEVEDIVMSYENIIGIHDFICHDYGPGRHIISLHAEVPAEQNLLSMHDTIDNIERTLSERLHCDTVIHMDPVMTNDEKTCQLRDQVTSIVKSIDSSLSIHDFRIVEGPTHTNLIFDIVVPFDAKLKDEIVIEKVYQTIKELNAHYYPVMKIDHSHIM